MQNFQLHALETFQGAFAEVFGSYSLALHLTVVVAGLMLLTGFVVLVVKVRGQSNALAAYCARDVGIGVLCAVSVLAFPGFFFFVGRALWNAGTKQG